MTQRRTLAVVGTPNVGKSTLFNALTGLRQKVGNFPGVTVEPLLGSVRTSEGAAELIDLPGVYGLDPTSEDERMTADVLRGEHPSIPRPDGLIVVLNGSAPEKCLALFSSLADLGLPTIVAVTMVDEVKARGGAFDDITLHHELGVPVVPVVGSRGVGVGDLLDVIVRPSAAQIPTPVLPPNTTPTERLTWATALVQRVVSPGNHNSRSEKLDRVLLHPILGTVIFIAVMAFFFQAIFTWSEPLMTMIENGVADLQRLVADTMDDGVVQNFVTNALLGGVGSVIVFLPQILILNVMIVVLEECGYLARAAFLIDRFMGVFGLQGRSFIPLLGSFACAIPGIMSARIIPNYRDRMATILAAPLMTCSARLPVYALIISAVVPATTVWGGFGLQGIVMSALFVAGALSGLLLALVLKRTMFRGGVVPFLMEFPPYRLPSLRSLGIGVLHRAKDFLTTAGTVILAFSIALWILTELPRADVSPDMTEIQASQHQLEQSFAADIGRSIQPVFEPLGFDWRITLGILGSYAARETFVGVMGQIYAADVREDDVSLRTTLRSRLSLSTGLAILAFYVYSLQCVSTMAVMKRETGSWKWPTISFVVLFVLAYLSAFIVYTMFS